jgi:ribulose-5-phosphate 4-epimerase/fuculose-1-phosphate aldolase
MNVTAELNVQRIDTRAITEEEWAIRRDLAACYRLVAMFGWDDLIATHLSARIPGEEETFLINPFGMLFDEITAANLVKVNAEGEKLDASPYPVNRAGFVIHSAVHLARPDVGCVMHLHTRDGVAVATLEEGLLPLNQTAMLLSRDIAFHEFEGVALDIEERERLIADLGDKGLMILRNHGTLATGRSVADCFVSMYYLETSCSVQVRTLAMGRPLHNAEVDVIDGVAGFRDRNTANMAEELYWPALLRKVERQNPGFDTRRG